MKFTKLQGYGNDYIVIESKELDPGSDINAFVRSICDRHYGPGSDGVALLTPYNEESADFRLRIFNPDGGEAAMSGNGSRCAAAYLYHHGLWSKETLRLSTRAGVKNYFLKEDNGKGRYRFKAELGRPAFESTVIPMRTREPLPRVTGYKLHVKGEDVEVTALQMCNPNCCVFVDNFEKVDWRRLGDAIESHEEFTERTNVEFVRIVNRSEIEARVWERGVGETLSSGTGACAAAVAAMINNKTGREITVVMPGGRLEVEWRERDDEVLLTGTAEVVYEGKYLAK